MPDCTKSGATIPWALCRGWRAGYAQPGVDMVVMAASCLVPSAEQVALSVAGVTVLCMIVGMNHRPGSHAGAN